MKKTLGLIAGLTLAASSAQAAVVWTFNETGSGVESSYSGTLAVGGLTPTDSGSSTALAIEPLGAAVIAFNGAFDEYAATPSAAFGSGSVSFGSSMTGALFGVTSGLGGRVYVPQGYDGTTTISGTLDFAGQSFASLGINAGSYTYTLPTDTVTLNFVAAAVPLPSGLALMLGALGLGGIAARRRKG